jgi:hypothetical protein
MRFTENCAIVAGVVDGSGQPMVAVMNDALAEQRVQHSIPLLRRNGQWQGIAPDKILPFLTAGLAPIGDGEERFSVVGWAGQAVATAGLADVREGLFRADGAPSTLRSVRAIGGVPHAVGVRRRVFRRLADGRWESLEAGIVEDAGDDFFGFEAADGFGIGEIYAAGIAGDLWLALDNRWQRLDSPTNVHLHTVLCTPDGSVLAGGRNGVLVEGRQHDWQTVETGLADTIWALCWFGGTLYVFSEEAVWKRREGTFERIGDPALEGGGFYHVSRSHDRMWCFARKKIVVFDGTSWQAEECRLADPVDADLLPFFDNRVLQVGSPYLPDD